MVHRLNRMLIALAIAAVGVAITASVASAQTCIVVNGVKVYIDENTYAPGGSNGNASFSSQTQIPAAGPLNEQLTVQSVNVTVTDPVLGTITTTIDPDAAQPISTIVSNDATNRYPATANITFNANATISSQPGNNYQSQSALVFTNSNLNSVLPFNDTFTLLNDVTFLDPVTGASFTLQGGTTNVTLN